MRGYFGIGIEHTKTAVNVGTLWRSARILGASFVFTIGRRYQKQCSDTMQAIRHIPLYHYETLEEFLACGRPHDCQLIGIELDEKAKPIHNFSHPERAIYLLGAEDVGLSHEARAHCQSIVVLPGKYSLNVAVAGTLVMYDRINKAPRAAKDGGAL